LIPLSKRIPAPSQSGVADGTTADSLVVDRHAPQQVLPVR
jgi:hypothetical protein